MPVYAIAERDGLMLMWRSIAIAAAGVIAGTALGMRLLDRVPAPLFRRIVAILLLALGTWILIRYYSRGGNP